MWKTSLVVLCVTFTVIAAQAPKGCHVIGCEVKCNTYAKDENGCTKCECADLCKDIVCGQGRVCKEFRIYGNSSFIPKCVDPSLPLECQQPPDPSSCRASKRRFYYDTDMKSCREFTYGGCLGNDNNFHTRHECFLKCMAKATKPQCGEVMCAMYCETGFQKNEQGCDICKCREKPQIKCNNTVPQCQSECPHGYLHRKDDQGCRTCVCRLPGQCPEVQCKMYCQFGFKQDTNGCDICECMDDPCKNRVCSAGEVCETIPICSPLTHNNCHYFGQCSASYTITRIRAELTYEHFYDHKTIDKDFLQTFVGKIKERLFEIMDAAHNEINFIEASPDDDILHVTFHVTNNGNRLFVHNWHTVEQRMRDVKNFIIAYHGHIFTPRANTLVSSYFSRDHPQPIIKRSFFNVITIFICVLGIAMIGVLLAIKAQKMRKPPQSKRVNVIYKQAPAWKPLV